MTASARWHVKAHRALLLSDVTLARVPALQNRGLWEPRPRGTAGGPSLGAMRCCHLLAHALSEQPELSIQDLATCAAARAFRL